MSPFRMNSMLAETSAFVSRFCAASDHATRHELDGVSSWLNTDANGTSASGTPTDAISFVSVQRRRSEPWDMTSTQDRWLLPDGNTQPGANTTRRMSSHAPRRHQFSATTADDCDPTMRGE